MIQKIMVAFCFIALVACHGKKEKHKNIYKSEDFFDTFQALKLPYAAVDTAMQKREDSTTITKETLSKYVPDSVTEKIANHSNAELHPVGRVDVQGNRYLILANRNGSNNVWYVLAFSGDNKFLAYMPILKNRTGDGYLHTLSVNAEPTFLMGRKKKDAKDNPLYTNEGFAYSTSAHRFTLVINDSNENLADANEIYVSIDTLPQTFQYSGNYRKDAHNIIVLRDGLRPNEYQFFYHFDKTDDDPDAKGEIKGILKMVSANAAVYQQGGDPCVIDFTFKDSRLKVKEEGNCANYRGSNLQFDDSFEKVHSDKKKKESSSKKK